MKNEYRCNMNNQEKLLTAIVSLAIAFLIVGLLSLLQSCSSGKHIHQGQLTIKTEKHELIKI